MMQARARRPLLLIDIAVPRDIEPACGDIEGVTLYDIDDLQAVVARNLEVRASERASAEAIVEEEIQRFARWMAQLDVVPTIAALREHGAGIVDQVLAENAGRWERASPRDLARIEAVARAVDAAAAARADGAPEGRRRRRGRPRAPAAPARAVRPRGGSAPRAASRRRPTRRTPTSARCSGRA